jgi:hypothetical protein
MRAIALAGFLEDLSPKWGMRARACAVRRLIRPFGHAAGTRAPRAATCE